jgi:hypothetical protein
VGILLNHVNIAIRRSRSRSRIRRRRILLLTVASKVVIHLRIQLLLCLSWPALNNLVSISVRSWPTLPLTRPSTTTSRVVAPAATGKRRAALRPTALTRHVAVNVIVPTATISTAWTRLWALTPATLLDAIEEGAGRAFDVVEGITGACGGARRDEADLDGLAVRVGAIEIADGVAGIAWVWHGDVGDSTGAVLTVVENLDV